MQERTIAITGEATKSFAPDTIAVSLEHSRLFKSYDEALNEVATRSGEIRQRIVESGLDAEKLKTSEFSVEPVYESYKDSHGDYKKRFLGYRNHARFEMCFPFDNVALSKLLGRLKGTEDKIEFSYRLNDPAAAKDEVMALATKAAIRKANIIAEAASVSLGDLLTIDYSVKEIRLSQQKFLMADCCYGSSDAEPEIDITPQELTLSDSVTVVYAIK